MWGRPGWEWGKVVCPNMQGRDRVWQQRGAKVKHLWSDPHPITIPKWEIVKVEKGAMRERGYLSLVTTREIAYQGMEL